jgi:hypothetical protein
MVIFVLDAVGQKLPMEFHGCFVESEFNEPPLDRSCLIKNGDCSFQGLGPGGSP